MYCIYIMYIYKDGSRMLCILATKSLIGDLN